MRTIVLLATALTVLAAPPVGRVLMPNQPNVSYGVVVPMPFLVKPPNDAPTGDILKFLRDTSNSTTAKTHLDVGAIRVDLFWADMQKQSSDPIAFDDPRYPDAIRDAIARKIHVFVSLSRTPAWATSTPCEGCPPDAAHLPQWQAFVEFVLNEFKNDLSNMTFGIWNEPDAWMSPAEYKDLVNSANQARTGPTAAARFGVLESREGAINAPLSWSTAALLQIQPLLKPSDVLTVHWYPGNRSQDLSVYMAKVLAIGNALTPPVARETWLTETGELKTDDPMQQETIGAILDVFNKRPSTQWSKIFVYRLFGRDPYDLMKTRIKNFTEELAGRESFFTLHRKIRTLAISLRADNSKFLSLADDARGIVSATATTAGSLREAFVIEDLDGEQLMDGDLVTLRSNGGMNLRVIGPDRAVLALADCACTDYDRFVVESGMGWTTSSAKFAFRSQATGKYVSRDTATSRLFATATAITNRETFTITVR
jgi:hypothetical protein